MIFGSRVKLEATVFVKSYLPGFQENCSIFLRHTISKSTYTHFPKQVLGMPALEGKLTLTQVMPVTQSN